MVWQATEFVSDIQCRKVEPYWLSLLGGSGTGKTMLAKIVMRFICQNCLLFEIGHGARLTDQAISLHWPTMIGEMKDGNFDSEATVSEKEEKWNGRKAVTIAYALIDDIGQVEDSRKAYLLATLGKISDARLGAWMIWTSNLYLAQIASMVDPRVSSRMIRGRNVVVENHCIDWNLR